MKIIILGAGQVGKTVAEVMANEDNDITVVDRQPDLLKELQSKLDIRTVAGHASHPRVLDRAGIEDADLIFAVTNDDETNMIACQVAYSLYQTPTRLARVRAFEYSNHPTLFRPTAMPVDYLINPEQLVTRSMLRLIERPGAFEVLDFADGRAQLVGVKAQPGAPLTGERLCQFPARIKRASCRFVALYRDGQPITPDEHLRVESGDEVYFAAATRDAQTVLSALSPTDHPVRRIIIAGGGNLGLHLAELVEDRYYVRLIERDAERCRHLAGTLRRTIVLNGDVTDSELLKAEGIGETDVFCSATHKDKTNIVSSILARQLGARTTLSIVNHAGFGPVSETSPNDIIISPAQATIGALLTHIRRGDVTTVYSLRRGTAEAMELVVHGDRTTSSAVGRKIGDLPLDEGVAVCVILRQNQLLFPDPDTVIESLDRVVLFLPDKQFIANVELLFQVAITFV